MEQSSYHEQQLRDEAGKAEIQQIYENLSPDLDLKLLFMAIGAYHKSSV